MKILIRDLRLGLHRDILKDVFEAAIPMTTQDLVLIFVTVTGQKHGRLTQETFVRKVYAKQVNGKLLSAIQLTTAAGVCAMVDLMVAGKIPDHGLIRQEEVSLDLFLGNRFGRHYAVTEQEAHAPDALAISRRAA